MISPARRKIVFQAIKAAILKGSEVEYWALRMYEQQEAGVLTDEQVAELEALIDEYYNPPVPEPTPEPAESEQDAAEGAEEGEPEAESTDVADEPESEPENAEESTEAEGE